MVTYDPMFVVRVWRNGRVLHIPFCEVAAGDTLLLGNDAMRVDIAVGAYEEMCDGRNRWVVKSAGGCEYTPYSCGAPVLDVAKSAPVGSIVKLGSLNVDGKMVDTDHDGERDHVPRFERSVCFWETTTDDKKNIHWVKVSEKLLIADRNLLNNISWDRLSWLGFVRGKEVRVDGNTYKVRLLTGGKSRSDINNEWDNYITNAANTSNDMWHWSGCFSWCQDVSASDASCRVMRGYNSVSYWGYHDNDHYDSNYGWRPALEIMN